jgi:hypothetical protein
MNIFFTFFRVPFINILTNTEVKILSIQEGISIQKTIRNNNNNLILL